MDQDTLIGGFEVEGNAKVVLLSEHFIVAQNKWLCNDENVYSIFRSTNM